MIEYRAYHKTRTGKVRTAGRTVRKKDKARAGTPPSLRARLRLIGWIAAGLLAVGFTGVACSEPRLIELAYAFEQAAKRRISPAEFP